MVLLTNRLAAFKSALYQTLCSKWTTLCTKWTEPEVLQLLVTKETAYQIQYWISNLNWITYSQVKTHPVLFMLLIFPESDIWEAHN